MVGYFVNKTGDKILIISSKPTDANCEIPNYSNICQFTYSFDIYNFDLNFESKLTEITSWNSDGGGAVFYYDNLKNQNIIQIEDKEQEKKYQYYSIDSNFKSINKVGESFNLADSRFDNDKYIADIDKYFIYNKEIEKSTEYRKAQIESQEFDMEVKHVPTNFFETISCGEGGPYTRTFIKYTNKKDPSKYIETSYSCSSLPLNSPSDFNVFSKNGDIILRRYDTLTIYQPN